MMSILSECGIVMFLLTMIGLIFLQLGKKKKGVKVCAGYPVLLPDFPKYSSYLVGILSEYTQNICIVLTDIKELAIYSRQPVCSFHRYINA